MFSALTNHKVNTFEQAFGVQDITTSEMRNAIQTWFAMFFDGAQHKDTDACQRLPAANVNKLTRAMFSEYTASVDGHGSKAAFMQRLLERLGGWRGGLCAGGWTDPKHQLQRAAAERRI